MRPRLLVAIFGVLLTTQAWAQTVVDYNTAGTTAWIAPTGVTTVQVELWGAGGGGAASQGNPAKGGGGAGGQYAKKIVTLTPGNSYNVVRGAAGGAGVANGTGIGYNGGAGGDSTFNATDVVAKGGAGGITDGAGGAGSATGCVGDAPTCYAGGSGTSGPATPGGAGGGGAGTGGAGGAASGDTGGSGTATYGGNGADAAAINTGGGAGSASGGGGAGGYSGTTTNRAGGAGGIGRARLTYTVPPFECTAGTICQEGTAQTSSNSFATTSSGVAITTTGTDRLIVCGLTIGGNVTPTGVGVSGATLGAFTQGPNSPGTAQYSGIWWKWSAGALTGESITATWVNSNSYLFTCVPMVNAMDPTGKVANTDYGSATNSGLNTSPTVSITTKGASNSWIFSAGHTWASTTFTADANSTALTTFGTGPLHWFEKRTSPVSAGTYSIGGTTNTSENWRTTAFEVVLGGASGAAATLTAVTAGGAIASVTAAGGAATALSATAGTGEVASVTAKSVLTTAITAVTSDGAVAGVTAKGGASATLTATGGTGTIASATATGGAATSITAVTGDGGVASVTATTGGAGASVSLTAVISDGVIASVGAAGGATTALAAAAGVGALASVASTGGSAAALTAVTAEIALSAGTAAGGAAMLLDAVFGTGVCAPVTASLAGQGVSIALTPVTTGGDVNCQGGTLRGGGSLRR